MESLSRLRQTPKQDTNFQRYTLDGKTTQEALELLHKVVFSSRGPNGRIKMVQNSAGGHLTLTSKSTRLFEVMSFTKPVIKLLVTASQGHLKHFNEGGNFIVLFSLNLILKAIKSGLNRKLIIEFFEEILNMTLNYLNSKNSSVKFKVKVSDLKHMSLVVKSILSSKPVYRLNGDDLNHISRLVLETFLNSLPSGDNSLRHTDYIYTLCLEGSPVSDSTLYKGLFVEFPEIPPHFKHEIKFNTTELNGRCGIKCAVVTVSMSGDTEEAMSMKCEIDKETRVVDAVLYRLKQFCILIVQEGVGILFCQKVLHPELKQFCRQQGLRVVDRLGLQLVNYVLDVTGAVPVPTFDSLNVDTLGWLSSIEHKVINRKSYLHLKSDKPMTTLVLCNTEEESLQELKVVCSSSLTILRQLLHSPMVLAGGGCWEVHLASLIRREVFEKKQKLMNSFGCTQSTLFSVCEIFAHSLELVAMAIGDEDSDNLTDRSYLHIWRVPKGSLEDGEYQCGCGINFARFSDLKFLTGHSLSHNYEQIEGAKWQYQTELPFLPDQNIGVVDQFSCSVNALQTAVMTAITVLSINQYIEDVS